MSFEDREGSIWFDGELVPWRDARVHVLTHTLHYGMGVFEGVRAYRTEQGPRIFRLDAHTRRLFDSAKIMGMTIPFDAATLNEAQKAVIRENGLESAYIRPMCFLGAEGMGLHRARHPGAHVVVRTPPRQRLHVPRQGQWPLHQLDARAGRGNRRRLR